MDALMQNEGSFKSYTIFQGGDQAYRDLQDGDQAAHEAMQIDLKSMPTFRDRVMLKEAEMLELELPLKVAYNDVPYAKGRHED